MARRYTRDARGRFASGGFSGQTGGRGARLMAKGTRAGGGAKLKAAAPAGAFRRGQSRRPAISRAEPLTTGKGTLAARSSLTRSRRRLAENPSPSQRGAVTRASRYAGMAKASNRQSLGQSPAGRFVRGRRSAPPPAARPQVPARGTLAARGRLRDARGAAAAGLNPSTARGLTRANRNVVGAQRANRQRLRQSPAGRLVPGRRRPGTGPANSVRRTGPRPLVQRGNNIRPYRPNTVDGRMNQIDRQIDRTMKPLVDDLRAISKQAQKARPQLDAIERELERMNAKDIANRNKKGIRGQVSRDVLAITGTKAGRKAIGRRMQRALSAASRGSAPAKRAVGVYLDQLAGMGPGRPSRGRNNLRPGPRNTRGVPRRRRRRKG